MNIFVKRLIRTPLKLSINCWVKNPSRNPLCSDNTMAFKRLTFAGRKCFITSMSVNRNLIKRKQKEKKPKINFEYSLKYWIIAKVNRRNINIRC